MKIGICLNPKKDEGKQFTLALTALFKKFNIEYDIFMRGECKDADVLAVLGGDGSILDIAVEAAKKGIPIVGFNLGELGFLSEFEREETENAVELISKGQLTVDERSMLEITVGKDKYFALNDAVVQRIYKEGQDAQVIKSKCYLNGNLLDCYVSDGVIASTPTGSTAYYLSAGGNILTPHLNAFAVSPICAHSLRSRPVIFPDTDELKITIVDNKESAALFADGKKKCFLDCDSELKIKKADFNLKFLRRKDWNFYDILLGKLNKWSSIK